MNAVTSETDTHDYRKDVVDVYGGTDPVVEIYLGDEGDTSKKIAVLRRWESTNKNFLVMEGLAGWQIINIRGTSPDGMVEEWRSFVDDHIEAATDLGNEIIEVQTAPDYKLFSEKFTKSKSIIYIQGDEEGIHGSVMKEADKDTGTVLVVYTGEVPDFVDPLWWEKSAGLLDECNVVAFNASQNEKGELNLSDIMTISANDANSVRNELREAATGVFGKSKETIIENDPVNDTVTPNRADFPSLSSEVSDEEFLRMVALCRNKGMKDGEIDLSMATFDAGIPPALVSLLLSIHRAKGVDDSDFSAEKEFISTYKEVKDRTQTNKELAKAGALSEEEAYAIAREDANLLAGMFLLIIIEVWLHRRRGAPADLEA